MSDPLPRSAQRVQSVLDDHNLSLQVVEFPDSTRTSQEAADAIGCELAQIAKTLVFRKKRSDTPVLVIASGANRVNEKALRDHLGEKVEKADADYAQEHTGYAIGGIPPVGHVEAIETYIDEDLLSHECIWAAAGTPHAVFRLTPQALVEITGGDIISVK